MSVSDPSAELTSQVISSVEAPAIPLELLLAIVDAALEDSRNGDSTVARCFASVSHALRAYTIPIIYEAIIIVVPEVPRRSIWEPAPKPTPIVGHDGRDYPCRQLAYVSWLLRDPTAEPRKYVKYLGFQHRGNFSTSDIGHMTWMTDYEDDSDLPAGVLDIDLLVVGDKSHASELEYAGVRARQVHVYSMEPVVINSFNDGTFTRMTNRSLNRLRYDEGTRRYFRCWIHVQTSRRAKAHKKDQKSTPKWESRSLVGMHCRQLDQVHNALLPGGHFFMIELHDNEAISHPDEFVDEISNILHRDHRQHVVLVLAPDDRAAIEKVAEIVGIAKKTLPVDLRKRLRVSHAGLDHMVLRRGLIQACFGLLRRGIDPWDVGHVPACLMSE